MENFNDGGYPAACKNTERSDATSAASDQKHWGITALLAGALVGSCAILSGVDYTEKEPRSYKVLDRRAFQGVVNSYEYNARAQTCLLRLDGSMGHSYSVLLVDSNCDRRVDTIYRPGLEIGVFMMPATAKDLEEATRVFNKHYEQMDVPRIHKEWQEEMDLSRVLQDL